MNRKRNLLSALALAAVGTLLLVGYVRAAEDHAVAESSTVPVLVLTHDTPRGVSSRALESSVEVRQVPADTRAADALTSVGDIDGRVPAADLFAGEQLVAGRLGDATELGTELADGTVAITLSLEPQRALGGQLHAGTAIDVLASFDDPDRTETTLRDVEVLSVARSEASEEEGPAAMEQQATDGVLLVTLAVPEARAESLVFAADHGRVWLAGSDDVALTAKDVIR